MDTTPPASGLLVDHEVLATCLGMSVEELAQAARVDVASLMYDPAAPSVQAGLYDIVRVLARAAKVGAEESDVVAWFRFSVLPGWGKTAQQLVELGHIEFVLEDLEAMEQGMYA